jgi:Ser-tRNA(Ala) deacylase AlaX
LEKTAILPLRRWKCRGSIDNDRAPAAIEGAVVSVKRYLDDPALSGTVIVTEIIQGERPIVRLAETWFHPQGGGQKADTGRIGMAEVVHVTHNEGEVDHHLAGLADLRAGESYAFSIDADRRRLNAAWHSAGHLIGSLVEARGGLKAVAGHQWPGEARVEFEGEAADLDEIRVRLEQDLADALARDLPVTPLATATDVRTIRMGDMAPIPCGGTHVARLGEIGRVLIASVKRKGARVRISYSVEASE